MGGACFAQRDSLFYRGGDQTISGCEPGQRMDDSRIIGSGAFLVLLRLSSRGGIRLVGAAPDDISAAGTCTPDPGVHP